MTSSSLATAHEQAAVLRYGNYITLLIKFPIVALILFLVVKGMNKLKRLEDAKPVEMADVPAQENPSGGIRDLPALDRDRLPQIDTAAEASLRCAATIRR